MSLRSMAVGCVLLVPLAGCGGSTTETGYQPKKLGMSGAEVRSLYAPAFSPDAKPPEASNGPQGITKRPGQL